MPNYCQNKLTLKHSNPEMVKDAIIAWNSGKFCNHFIPMPEDLGLLNHTEYYPDRMEEYKLLTEEMKKQNLEKYGFESWYEFRLYHFGTKWDFGNVEEPYPLDATELCVRFDTAWSDPTGIYHHLVSLGYEIEALYAEPNGDFCGYFRTPEDNQCYNFWDKSCPDFIDKEFGIHAFVDEVDADMYRDDTMGEEEAA